MTKSHLQNRNYIIRSKQSQEKHEEISMHGHIEQSVYFPHLLNGNKHFGLVYARVLIGSCLPLPLGGWRLLRRQDITPSGSESLRHRAM